MGTHALEETLGYKFKDKSRLLRALTHNSYSPDNNYQRLEFIGDSKLKSMISRELYDRYPKASEGRLSKAYSNITSNAYLAKVSDRLNIAPYIRVGPSIRRISGSIKADVVESIIGAMVIDSSYNKAKKIVVKIFESELASLGTLEELKDSKSKLCEYTQKHDLPFPVYSVVTITGAPHNQTFTVLGSAAGISKKGKGKSCKAAEQEAAKALLEALDKSDSV